MKTRVNEPAINAPMRTEKRLAELVFPVFNERLQLEASIRACVTSAASWRNLDLRIAIADNGSTDGTTEIARRLSESLPNVRHSYLREKGRGRALRYAWMESKAEILAYMDVDLSTDISFFPALIEPLARGEADVSTGSRLLRPEWTERGWKREILSRMYNGLLGLVFKPSFSDAQCGFKAITKKAANELLPLVEDNDWFFDSELLLLAQYFGYRIYDLPVQWKDDSDSRVKIIPTIIQDLKGIVRMKRLLRASSIGNLTSQHRHATSALAH